jgi:SAM-dependent methyltransferase
MDFGPSAADYASHRKGFPPSFFDRLPLAGRLLDLGSGTGGVAAGYAARGAKVVALDRSSDMLRQAPAELARVVARAERCPFGDGSFDAVIAGQCWHWFDGPVVARECARLVRPGGTVAIAHLDYVLERGGVAEATEAVVLRHNPGWPMAGTDGIYERWRPELVAAGLVELDSFWYDERFVYRREAWRGRIRACNGVIELPDPAARAAVDREIAATLERFAEPLEILHRVFVLTARRPQAS